MLLMCVLHACACAGPRSPGPGDHYVEVPPTGPAFSFSAPNKPPTPSLQELQQQLQRLLNKSAAGSHKLKGDACHTASSTKQTTAGGTSKGCTTVSGNVNTQNGSISAGSTGSAKAGRLEPPSKASYRASGSSIMHTMPGPGDYYSLPAATAPSGPAYSMAAKPKTSSPMQNPGPGAYNDMKWFPRPLGDVVGSIMRKGGDSNTGSMSESGHVMNSSGVGSNGNTSISKTQRRVSWADATIE